SEQATAFTSGGTDSEKSFRVYATMRAETSSINASTLIASSLVRTRPSLASISDVDASTRPSKSLLAAVLAAVALAAAVLAAVALARPSNRQGRQVLRTQNLRAVHVKAANS